MRGAICWVLLPLLAAGCGGKSDGGNNKSASAPEGSNADAKTVKQEGEKPAAKKGVFGKLKTQGGGFGLMDPFGRSKDAERPPAAPPLKGLSVEDFNRSWKSDYRETDRPARELLAELAKRGGMELETRSRRLAQLDKRVSLDLKQRPLVQAIEEVCRQVGVRPDYRSGFGRKRVLSLKAGARVRPAVYAGPFVVGVDSVNVAARYATGTLKLTVAALELPQPVQQVQKQRHDPPLKIETLTGSNGADVRQPEGTSWSNDTDQQVGLKKLLRGVETISLRGTITVPVPEEVQQLRFTQLKPGETKTAGNVTVTLKRSQSRTLTTLQLQYTKPGPGNVEFTPLDGKGQPLRIAGRGRFSVNDRVNLELTVSGRPASLRAEHGGRSATFQTLQAGRKRQLAGGEIVLRNVRFADRHSLTFEFTNADPDRIFVRGLDAEGKPLHGEGRSSFSGGRMGQVRTTVLGSPATVVVSVVTGLKELEYAVALKDIPVPGRDRRPEKLDPLKFAGTAPVTIENRGVDGKGNFKKVKLRVKNRSNKDIKQIDLRLHYLDASGKELKNWPGNARGSFDFDAGGWAPVVKAGKTAEVEVTAFFMPAETKRVEVTLEEVLCADTTRWKPRKK